MDSFCPIREGLCVFGVGLNMFCFAQSGCAVSADRVGESFPLFRSKSLCSVFRNLQRK
jgi:hypothetical protein